MEKKKEVKYSMKNDWSNLIN